MVSSKKTEGLLAGFNPRRSLHEASKKTSQKIAEGDQSTCKLESE